jgi:hypothetical protein
MPLQYPYRYSAPSIEYGIGTYISRWKIFLYSDRIGNPHKIRNGIMSKNVYGYFEKFSIDSVEFSVETAC